MTEKISRVVNFGCRLNDLESQVIDEILVKTDAADNVVVFNTCAVTQEAERQARQSIRKYRKDHPDANIIVTGCAAQINPDQFSDMKEVNKVIGNTEKLSDEFYRESFLNNDEIKLVVNDIMSIKETAGHLVQNFEGKARAYVQIQNGCNHRCTFCTIPYARGNSRSVPIGEIVEAAKRLIKSGYKEIVLTGVDITDYGLDLPGKPNLGQMCRRLLNLVPNLPRLRLSSIDVAEIGDELMQLILFEKRFMPHLHISLQAGDDMILKRMKRRHSRKQVVDFCNYVRDIRPEIAFGADMIAGFPTETEEMFQNSLNLIEEAGLQFLHVFPYSEREGTPAERMPQVAKHIRKKRAKMLRSAGEVQMSQFLNKMLGTKVSVIIEHNNIARAENFAQIQLEHEDGLEVGSVIDVVIISIKNNILCGVIDR